MNLVLDTGPIIALLNAGDPDHCRCSTLLATADEDLHSPRVGAVKTWCY